MAKSGVEHAHLLVVGSGPDELPIREAAAAHGVSGRVHLLGSLGEVDKYRAIAAADVFASTSQHEGFGLVFLEAMAMGVPVVTSRTAAGGVDAAAGEHFLVGTNPAQYAAAILAILQDPALRRRLAIDGRARMLSHHAWPRSMQKLDGIIDRCRTIWSRQRSARPVQRATAT
jgi:hypothetical protein